MITGACILVVGVATGYALSLFRNPYSKPARMVKKIVSGRAIIINTDPDIDLGQNEETNK